jgi:protein TonB
MARPRIKVGDTLNCNKLVHYVRPVYPKDARQNRIEGTVTLRARITKAGDLQDITVLKGNPIFVPEAVRVAKQWRYTPCLIDSEPVEVITTLDISFNLSQ